MATGIGSLPLEDPDRAAALSLANLPEAPFWPQLPRRSFLELMDAQYTQGLPGVVTDGGQHRVHFDSSRDLTGELERFYAAWLARDLDQFALSPEYAAGFHAFRERLARGLPDGVRFLKGHVTGPLTAGVSLKDRDGVDVIHHELLYDVVVKGLALKAAWQVRELSRLGRPVIVFIDEPAMESLGSAFSSVAAETVAERIDEVADMIHEFGGLAGIHCCGNADWPLLFARRVDIVNFDAFDYLDRVLLYPAAIASFLERGGSLAWGIVPTGSFTGAETAQGLAARLEGGIGRLEAAGVPRTTLVRQGIVTPACGLGSLPESSAEAILRLTAEVSSLMRARG
jgi:methionine synthase II (cobalamin-independent)